VDPSPIEPALENLPCSAVLAMRRHPDRSVGPTVAVVAVDALSTVSASSSMITAMAIRPKWTTWSSHRSPFGASTSTSAKRTHGLLS
jgi:hypothetical protein